MELEVLNQEGEKSSALQVSDQVFARAFNEPLVHQVVVAYAAAKRTGSKAQKTRSEVRGGGAKPWRQKGTGRARAGTIRSPIWTGGGVTFAAKPRDHSQKVNKKMYGHAMAAILSELNRQKRLVVVDQFEVKSPKTKELLAKLKSLSKEKLLLVLAESDENLQLAARNVPNIKTDLASSVDPISLVGSDKIIITVDAIKKLEERLG